ncbi:ring domain containing protein [Pandoravirus japonicus]|uniref:Ring domain containing protein n=1 Tax=Pandoravirus japonicus TaxID=2823154 RepID=A0A811BSI6_9VIRU|nr:ring domain containing protein [Pandoravirus japonicus]
MDDGWGTAPSTVDQCIGEWLESTRRAARLLRRACLAAPSTPARPRCGPVVACIDLTKDDYLDDHQDHRNGGDNRKDDEARGALIVVDLTDDDNSIGSLPTCPRARAGAIVGDVDRTSRPLYRVDRRDAVSIGTGDPNDHDKDNGNGASNPHMGIDRVGRRRGDDEEEDAGRQDTSDDSVHLVRRRRQRRRDVSRKRRRRHDATVADERPFLGCSGVAHPGPPTLPGPFGSPPAAGPAPSAPSASLFDWDAFRLSLPRFPDGAACGDGRARPLPDTLFGAALFSPPGQGHPRAPPPCWDISPLRAALYDLAQDVPSPWSGSLDVDRASALLSAATTRASAGRADTLAPFGIASAPSGVAPAPSGVASAPSEVASAPSGVASAPPQDLFAATDGDTPQGDADGHLDATAAQPTDADRLHGVLEVATKPAAGLGDIVLVDVDGRRVAAVLARFDGARYGLALCRVVAAEHRERDARWLWLSVTGTADKGARWRNAPLAECAVCMDAEADALVDCRCTVPAMCMDCAVRLDRCPYCDAVPQSDPKPIERDLCIVPAVSPWIDVPLRIVLDGVRGPTSRLVRAQVDWPGVLLRAVVHEIIGDARRDMRLLVGGRTIVDQRPIGAQGVVDGALVCVIPRLRGD